MHIDEVLMMLLTSFQGNRSTLLSTLRQVPLYSFSALVKTKLRHLLFLVSFENLGSRLSTDLWCSMIAVCSCSGKKGWEKMSQCIWLTWWPAPRQSWAVCSQLPALHGMRKKKKWMKENDIFLFAFHSFIISRLQIRLSCVFLLFLNQHTQLTGRVGSKKKKRIAQPACKLLNR